MAMPEAGGAQTAARAPRRLYRSREERIVGGVAAGLGHYLRVDPLWVRLAFVVLASAGGLGALVYVAAWIMVPEAEPGEEIHRHAQPRRSRLELIAGGLMVIGVVLLLRNLGVRFADGVVLPAALVAVGLVLIWRRSSPERRAALVAELEDLRARRMPPALAELLGRGTESPRLGRASLMTVVRVGAGVAFLVGGIVLFAAATDAFGAVRDVAIAFVILLAGLTLMFGPWAWRLARELAAERRERIRSQERAEMAAHLHDSVLQTLALIQRQADDPAQMARLARGQERELRSWLYGGEGARRAGSLSAALEEAAATIEDLHGVHVDVVSVGDTDVDEDLDALLGAAREAIVNAARLSGDERVSVYLEVEPERVTCFVRDRGVGFDRAAVPADRKGVSESIVARMERHGGTAAIRTAPGEGTEVELRLPRSEGPSAER